MVLVLVKVLVAVPSVAELAVSAVVLVLAKVLVAVPSVAELVVSAVVLELVKVLVVSAEMLLKILLIPALQTTLALLKALCRAKAI